MRKKSDKRKVQGEETKQRLYIAGEKLFNEHDFDSVSVEDITDAAGITKGGFYVHFKSKDELISLIIREYALKADFEYRTFLENAPAEMAASQMLVALCDNISDTLINTIGYENMKKVYQMMLTDNADTEPVKGYGRELYALFDQVLRRGMDSGEFKSFLPLDSLSRYFVLAIRGISYEWCIQYPDFNLKEQMEAHIRLLLEGIINR